MCSVAEPFDFSAAPAPDLAPAPTSNQKKLNTRHNRVTKLKLIKKSLFLAKPEPFFKYGGSRLRLYNAGCLSTLPHDSCYRQACHYCVAMQNITGI